MKIENGIVTVKDINGIPFFVDLIPTSNYTSRPQVELHAEYITIHNTGNSAETADADMHTEYVDTTKEYVSWHFTVDDKKIYQELPIDEVGYHCSNGNFDSIGIEICETGDYEKAEENAIKLIIFLMKEMNIQIDKVVPHQFWSNKFCPHLILNSEGGFEGFKERIVNEMNEKLTADEIIEKAFDAPELWIEGCDLLEQLGKIEGDIGNFSVVQYIRSAFEKVYYLDR